jgi:hypothetical protein
MSGCSLQEAFPDTAQQSGKRAKKEERSKARRCGGPALAFLKSSELDADRQNLVALPPAEKLEGREGYTQSKIMEGFAAQDAENKKYMPVKVTDVQRAERDLLNNLTERKVSDVIGSANNNTLPRAAESASQLPDFSRSQTGNPVPSYFGKGADDEGFADFSASMTDNPGYEIRGSDFMSAFGKSGFDKITGKDNLPIPALDMVWKPITPSGVNTAFFPEARVVPSVPSGPSAPPAPPTPSFAPPPPPSQQVFSNDEKTALLRKLDTLFARLEDLEAKRNEHSQTEIALFIASGLLLMFGFETVRKLR